MLLPVAIRSKKHFIANDDYRKQTWNHQVNDYRWSREQKVKIAGGMCDIVFGLSVTALFNCLTNSLEHSQRKGIPPFVCITDRVKETFDHLPKGTEVSKTSKEYKKLKIDLL